MSISYPLSLPSTTPQVARIDLVAYSAVGITTSPFTFSSQRQEHAGMFFGANVSLPFMLRADAEEWIAFLLALNGPTGTFLMGDPAARTPRGTATGTPRVNGASQTGQTLITDGWTINITNILRKGDYIQLGNRLYKVLLDVNSDGSGNATLDIWPRIRESPADDTAITTNNTVGLFRLTSTEIPLTSTGGHEDSPVYSVSFSAIEAI